MHRMRLCEKMQADPTAVAPTCFRLLDKVIPASFTLLSGGTGVTAMAVGSGCIFFRILCQEMHDAKVKNQEALECLIPC